MGAYQAGTWCTTKTRWQYGAQWLDAEQHYGSGGGGGGTAIAHTDFTSASAVQQQQQVAESERKIWRLFFDGLRMASNQ